MILAITFHCLEAVYYTQGQVVELGHSFVIITKDIGLIVISGIINNQLSHRTQREHANYDVPLDSIVFLGKVDGIMSDM